ncbi:MAG TPA: hypothetical protein VN643_03415 [Pyrinomonadaceae bacterium]|nr:hypothetical protein [Pyrinomonadaceae bacterium]
MNSEQDTNEIRKERHRVFATIKVESSTVDHITARTVERVLCKVFLPFRKTDKPLLYFLPTDEQELQLQQTPVFRMEAEVVQPNGTHTVITANQVHIVSHTGYPWGPGQTEHILIGEPWDLKIEHIRPPGTYHPDPRSAGCFWLSRNQSISNVSVRSRSYTGEVKLEKLPPLTVSLTEKFDIAFDLHMGYRDERLGQTVMFDETAAEFALPFDCLGTPAINDAMNQLEDVLRLISFVGEYRCVCVGWRAGDSRSVTEFYRPRNVPDTEPPSVHEGLIEYQYFNEFIMEGYKQLVKLTSPVAFRRALDYVIPDDNDTLESSYIMLYAAVETLVSFFRKLHGLEKIFDDENEWLQLSEDLREWLKSHPLLVEDKKKRGLVKEKVSELKRPAFSHALGEFCKYYGVDLGDLWPMTGQREGDSLSAIRNKLVHGEVYRSERYQALMGAREHLRWSVYRMIFGILGWPITQTKIVPARVARNPVHKSWTQDRTILSKQL